MFRPFFDEQMFLLSHKIIHILSGFIIIYSAINEHKLFKSEKFMNENKKCILPVWKRIFIVIVDVFIVILTLTVIDPLMYQLPTTVLMYLQRDSMLFLAPALVLYYTISEAIFNSTIGKVIFGAKVFHIGEDVSSLSSRSDRFINAFKRSIFRLNPFNILCLFSSRPIFYHDLFTDTITISKSKLMEDFSEEDPA